MHANNPIKYTDPDGRYVSELEANPSEEMYNLLAERDKDGDECPECEPGTMLNTVHVTDRRVWDFMKAEEGEKDWFFTEDDPSTVINWGEFTINPASQTPEGITHDYSFLEPFIGVEELALKGAAKFAVVPFIVKIGRPNRFRKGVVEKVWEKAKKEGGGKVIDPKSQTEIIWDGSKPRNWDMGHIEGKEFRELREAYERGEISKKQFLDEYNNPANYRPELPSSNRSNNQR